MILTSKNKGFTLFEMLIVSIIIIILSAMFFLNYKSGRESMALQRATHKLAQDIRRVQSMAGLKEDGCFDAGLPRFSTYQYGYGILLTTADPKGYTLFADCDGDKIYDLGEIVEFIEFEKEIEFFSSFTNQDRTRIWVVFVPPDPSVYIRDNPLSKGTITIRVKNTPLSQREITIHTSGLIEY